MVAAVLALLGALAGVAISTRTAKAPAADAGKPIGQPATPVAA
jgi:hypothetical protein